MCVCSITLPFICLRLRKALLLHAPEQIPHCFATACIREWACLLRLCSTDPHCVLYIVAVSHTNLPPKISEWGWTKSLEVTVTKKKKKKKTGTTQEFTFKGSLWKEAGRSFLLVFLDETIAFPSANYLPTSTDFTVRSCQRWFH